MKFPLTSQFLRHDTPPGCQLQIDFGTVRVPVADEPLKVHMFVATLDYSRRTFVAMFLHELQSAWLQGLEDASRHFGGTTQEVPEDNARALVSEHDLPTREIRFNDRLHTFCWYGKVTPRGPRCWIASQIANASVASVLLPFRNGRTALA